MPEPVADSYKWRLLLPIGRTALLSHARSVKSGYGTVSLSLLMFAALSATKAGREGETGVYALSMAPDLLGAPAVPVQTCAQSAPIRPRDLVFEMVEPGEVAEEEIQRLSMTGREVVSFEWNAATGELSYSTTAPTAVFSDLALSSPASRHPAPGLSCE